jgi:hypothetical protein
VRAWICAFFFGHFIQGTIKEIFICQAKWFYLLSIPFAPEVDNLFLFSFPDRVTPAVMNNMAINKKFLNVCLLGFGFMFLFTGFNTSGIIQVSHRSISSL